MSKGPRTDVIALAALASAAALGIALLVARSPGGGGSPLEAVPADAFLVASIDVAALGRSPLGEALVGHDGEGGSRTGALLGVDSITATCGFDPLPHLRAIAVAIPEGGERGAFGVAASGDLTKASLASCAKALIAKRGGRATTRESGSFTVVSDASTPAGAEVAFRDGGPYLVGEGPWLAKMIDAVEGRAPSMATSTSDVHHALRADLAARDRDAEAVVVTAILPHDLRDRVQREMATEATGGGRGGAAMQGVLSVSAAAVGLHAARAHEDARLVGVLRCETNEACEAVSTLILHARLGWSGNLGYRLFGLGALIDNLAIQRQGTSLVVTTHAPVDDLAKMVERALGPPPPRKPFPAASAAPDEVISARNDAGAR